MNDKLSTVPATAPSTQPGQAGPTATNPPVQQAPPPDVLYNNALRDYNSGNYDLASQEFKQYMQFYSSTPLAGNAQFYLADIEYQQKNYQAAVDDYDKVLEQYPSGNKTPTAQLKKGFALLELGQKDAGVRELRNLIARYPRSIEATQAQDRLRRLNAAPATARRRPGE
jgi:tol-pal system protein YbgF